MLLAANGKIFWDSAAEVSSAPRIIFPAGCQIVLHHTRGGPQGKPFAGLEIPAGPLMALWKWMRELWMHYSHYRDPLVLETRLSACRVSFLEC